MVTDFRPRDGMRAGRVPIDDINGGRPV